MTPGLSEGMKENLHRAIATARVFQEPYRHWALSDVFPKDAFESLKTMPFPVADIDGVSGTREAHNADRIYLSGDNLETFPVARGAAEAFQAPETVDLLEETCGCDLDRTYLRMEYAQDVDGFWLEPHTDIGVKRFTMLLYMSDDPRQIDLGTDIYSDENTHYGRLPFEPNTALIFVPATNTWHGFEKRTIHGIRRSIIINYVTEEWRARDQLAYPDALVRSKAHAV